MRQLIVLLAVLIVSGCANHPMTGDEAVYQSALNNFVYVSDTHGAKTVREDFALASIADSVDVRFEGDCEDFAQSLQKQIGGDVWFAMLKTGEAHAVLVKGGNVYDFYHVGETVESYSQWGSLLFIVQ